MHVREIPEIIFGEIAESPQDITVRNDAMRLDLQLKAGHFNALGLILDTDTANDDYTSLRIYRSYDDALRNDPYDNIAALHAGNRMTGVWAKGLGEQREQSVQLAINDVRAIPNSSFDLETASAAYGLVATIATRAQELIDTGNFEISRFFPGQVRPQSKF